VDDKRQKAIKQMIKRSTTANTASPEAARAWLITIGIHTQTGELRKAYGGSKLKAKVSKSKGTA